jgi:hypothetical protein
VATQDTVTQLIATIRRSAALFTRLDASHLEQQVTKVENRSSSGPTRAHETLLQPGSSKMPRRCSRKPRLHRCPGTQTTWSASSPSSSTRASTRVRKPEPGE